MLRFGPRWVEQADESEQREVALDRVLGRWVRTRGESAGGHREHAEALIGKITSGREDGRTIDLGVARGTELFRTDCDDGLRSALVKAT